MLKKQTVWLLTMLSLIVVLSVYALTVPEEPERTSSGSGEQTEETSADNKKEEVKTTSVEEKLAEIAVKKEDERSKLDEEYQNVIASEDSSTKEVSEAHSKLEELQTIAGNEMILEDVMREKGYHDAVVKTDGREIQIFVGADKLSDQQANELIQLANKYVGTGRIVSVNYTAGNP